MPPPPVPPPLRDDSSDGRLAQLLGERSLWQVLPTFVLLGIGLAFTPCMLPMLPILTGLIVDSGAGPRQATMLSLAFVLAMAATYATLGAAAALSALKQQGLAIVGPFQSAAGTTAWAGYIGDRPVALYPTPDGRHVIAGTLLDAQGKDADHERLLKAVGHALTDALWNNLADSRWIADGSTAAPPHRVRVHRSQLSLLQQVLVGRAPLGGGGQGPAAARHRRRPHAGKSRQGRRPAERQGPVRTPGCL